MLKRILIITTVLLLLAVPLYAEFGGSGGAFGAIWDQLKTCASHIVPSATNTYNLGSSTSYWNNLYVTTVAAGTTTFTLPAAGTLTIDGATTDHTSTAPIDCDIDFDTATATTDVIAWDIDVDRAATDTGGTRGMYISVTTGAQANGETSYCYGGIYDTSACTAATSNMATFYADASTGDAQCNDYALYIADGYDTDIYGADDLILSSADVVTITGAADASLIATAGDVAITSGDDTVITTTGKLTLTPTEEIDWTTGNVIYVPIGGSIEAYHDLATAGDTLILASGTYTVTDDIDITKAINIVGQGIGKTTISCATASKNVFELAASNIRIADMTITNTGGAVAYGINCNTNNLTGHVLENLDITVSGAGANFGFTTLGSNLTARNVTVSCSSSDSNATAFRVQNSSSTTQNITANLYNVSVVADGTGFSSTGFTFYNNNDANTITANLYDCVGRGEAGGGADTAISVSSTTTNTVTANFYGGTFYGQDYDVTQGGTNTLTLYDTVLVNGTTSGTITYGGTVVTGALGVGGANTTGNIATLTQNSDTIGFLLDGTDAYTKWSDGISYLMTDEGTNTLSAVYVKGKGTGAGRIGVMDGSNTNYVTVFTQTDGVCATSYGSSVTEFVFNEDSQDVDFRVESDTMTHAFFVDGATGDVVGQTIAISNQHDEIGILLDILTAPKAIVGFTGTGATTTTETGYENGAGRTWTYSGGLATDKIFQGSTYVYSFDGTDSYLSTPDTADMSFDDSGTAPVSMGGWVYVDASSTKQTIFSKWDVTTGAEAREYLFTYNASNKWQFEIFDESANVECYRTADAVTSAGWHFIVMTYVGTGGATAANGITFYEDGVLKASSATNDGSYVAMENLATVPRIGANMGTAALQQFFKGDMGRLFVTGEELSAATIWKMYEQTRGHYNK